MKMRKGKIYLIRERDTLPDNTEVVVSHVARLDRINNITYELTVLARNPHPDPAPRRMHATHVSDDGGIAVDLDALVITQFDLDGGNMLVTEVEQEYLPVYLGWPWKSREFDKVLKGEK